MNSRCSKFFLLCCIAALLFCGCATTGSVTHLREKPELVMTTNAVSGKVVGNYFPELKPATCQKLNPVFWFGNIDDPVPPDWYRPDNRMRTFLWHCRNPFHNLFFYVIGIADKEFEIVGEHPGRISDPNGGWNWTVCKYKWLRLPLVSYQRGNFNFYLGWRNRGNFGMKFNYSD